MLTVWEYAEQVAAGDTGSWRAATRRAADMLAAPHPTIELPRIVPMQQILLQTTALLIYGLAQSRHADPGTVTGNDLAGWVTQQPVPAPPDPDDTVAGEQWTAAAMRWIPAMKAALQRQRDDLARLLRAAGHEVPGRRTFTDPTLGRSGSRVVARTFQPPDHARKPARLPASS